MVHTVPHSTYCIMYNLLHVKKTIQSKDQGEKRSLGKIYGSFMSIWGAKYEKIWNRFKEWYIKCLWILLFHNLIY